jgi:hypothetical protein
VGRHYRTVFSTVIEERFGIVVELINPCRQITDIILQINFPEILISHRSRCFKVLTEEVSLIRLEANFKLRTSNVTSSTKNDEQAYADLKAQLIEEARIRKQQALEKSLADKRAAQEAYAESLKKDEIRQFNEQTQALNVMRQSIDQEISSYTARYEKTPEQALDYAKGKFGIDDSQILSELESVRLRLELEAETLIEESVASYRSKLQAAAQEEIDYILKNSNFSDEMVSNSA